MSSLTVNVQLVWLQSNKVVRKMHHMKGDNFMKLKQSVNLLLIAFFVWAFQSSTIHFQHHEIEEISECSLCHTSGQFDLTHHNSSTVIVNENFAVKTRKYVEKIVVRSRFDYTLVPQVKWVDIVEDQQYAVASIPLGYYAMAPPSLYA